MDISVGILIGETEPENAIRLAETFGKCPYCAASTQSAGTILGLFVIPMGHNWWLEWVEKRPKETLGLQKAEAVFARAVTASSPWSRGEIAPILDSAPCGANCLECTMYREKCPGCPATRHFLGE